MATEPGDAFVGCSGYDPAFLPATDPAVLVNLPTLGPLVRITARHLVDSASYLLPYRGYTVAVHSKRRLALFSAANVDFSHRYDMPRPKDRWLFDDRISRAAQIGPGMYAANQFDRGHLTRREDMEYGATRAEALASAATTCVWTNCTPQHAKFNQSKQLWQGVERHLLEEAIQAEGFRGQVITGPVFGLNDPVLEGFAATPYPLRYWKVAAAISQSGKLFATAFLLDQRPVINEFGTRAAPEVPFGPYKTFQTTIAEIERLTKMKFTARVSRKRMSLSEFDPLAKRASARGVGMSQPSIELDSFRSIVVG